jgi:hypothetical protein
MKYSPDGRLHAGSRGLRLETELSAAAMFESISRRGQKDYGQKGGDLFQLYSPLTLHNNTAGRIISWLKISKL